MATIATTYIPAFSTSNTAGVFAPPNTSDPVGAKLFTTTTAAEATRPSATSSTVISQPATTIANAGLDESESRFARVDGKR